VKHTHRAFPQRLALGLSRDAVARRAGITPKALYNAETGRARPLPNTLSALASALDCDVDELADYVARTPRTTKRARAGALRDSSDATGCSHGAEATT
jgi:transcriptional regulator with XRE-family HTH domain